MSTPRRMDPAEQSAFTWLSSNYPRSTLAFEPDGNVPPDFLLDGSIAIEVRRFNESRYDHSKGRPVGLDEDTNKLFKFLEDIFIGLKSVNGLRYWVHVDIVDPTQLCLDKPLARSIKASHASLTGGIETTEHPGFELEWTPMNASGIPDDVAIGGATHANSGGFIRQVYLDNLRALIAAKALKIMKAKFYNARWLILVDYIFPGTQAGSTFDLSAIHKGPFERVILIDRNGVFVFEVGQKGS